jgi:DNA-binding response OmpR family regulator
MMIVRGGRCGLAFHRAGFQVTQAHDGYLALQQWIEEKPDLIILDINLPKIDGFTVCQRIRAEDNTPIILLTVRDNEDDILHGLELGADLYLTKPFSLRQLVARAQALLRRARSSPDRSPLYFRDGRRVPDPRLVCVRPGYPVALSPLERRLWDCLLTYSGQAMDCDAIIEHIWGCKSRERAALRQLVRRLRSKIEPNPTNPIFIKTVPGIGYRLATMGEQH